MLLDTGSRITILHKCLDRRTTEAENIAKFPLLKCNVICVSMFSLNKNPTQGRGPASAPLVTIHPPHIIQIRYQTGKGHRQEKATDILIQLTIDS